MPASLREDGESESAYSFEGRAFVDLQRMSRMEWLEADGLGGFASGTAAGIRTRRYHAEV
ncbi:MAG: glycogen debranching enzyme N-terminal domain-containing protein [Nitrospirota bacterium]|nr:glycogen debranching enzyme N-terminal domain-containing protein [Nitrospirota bacterium]